MSIHSDKYKSVNIQKARAYILPKQMGVPVGTTSFPNIREDAKLPQYYMAPLQLQRVVNDMLSWRQSIAYAENAMNPHRYYQQRMYIDTILDAHVVACMKKRRGLTLLKDFVIQSETGEVNKQFTKIFNKKTWFKNLVSYIIDAQFFGYTLVQLGDMQSPKKDVYHFPRLLNLKRWNVSPDRQNLVKIPLELQGINFLDPESKDPNGNSYCDGMLYVDTPNETGSSVCGFGLLYTIAPQAIILKNNLANNSDYNQMFATPYRHAKTEMTLEVDARNELEKTMTDMGASGWAITDKGIEIEFKETNSGQGYKSYENLDARCKADITKQFFGHEDIFKTTPGKQTKDDEESPSAQALEDTEKEQDSFVLNVLNDSFIHKLKAYGIIIPEGLQFGIKNDKEKFEVREKEDKANVTTATIAKIMKEAGMKIDSTYFTERTGIKFEEVEEPIPTSGFGDKEEVKNTKKKLKAIYL